MKEVISLITLALLQISCYAVNVETMTNLNAYYPEYSKIDLVCEQMPKNSQKDVEFCCEAAFTGELLNEFKHSNIADNHICDGIMKKGYRCKANTGGFVWGKGKWMFMRKADYPTTANGYYNLKPAKSDIAQSIEKDPSYVSQNGRFSALLNEWKAEIMPQMKAVGQGARPKELITDWSF